MEHGSKQKLKTFSIREKRRLIEQDHKGVKKKKDIARNFVIPANTLSTILKRNGSIKRACEGNILQTETHEKSDDEASSDESISIPDMEAVHEAIDKIAVFLNSQENLPPELFTAFQDIGIDILRKNSADHQKAAKYITIF
ncbi:hypothetical protein Zmor_014666 [Zophobas morio]|uniref:HTH psq-type domain-containing protein n=1 Tax=Zophobas morio TaxID=2755281 RepID=A0AA38IGI0_9CUCU|nr:hypothetical protein Zmor_014666 [Zophobas morio]